MQIWVLLHILTIKKDILVHGRGPTQRLVSTLTAEKCTQLTLTLRFYDFSADYNAVTFDDIKEVHNYFMKKNDIV